MFLTQNEHEAFVRGQAARLIPLELSPPSTEKELDDLIFHIGLLFSVRFAYRNRGGKLRTICLTAFTQEHLDDLIRRLPEIRHDEVWFVTNFRREIYPNMLEGLYQYFAFGKEIIAAQDLAGRLAVNAAPIPMEQILKGFEIKYVPVIRTGLATSRQKAVLAEMIYNQRLPSITRRKWENMTTAEASQLISSLPQSKAELPVSVALVLDVIDRLNPEERGLLDKLITPKITERKIA